MRAVVYQTFGSPDVFTLQEKDPPIPSDNQVLVKIKAVAVTAGEIKARSKVGVDGIFWLPGRLIFGFSKPKHPVLGSYYSGVIEETGTNVTRFSPGDQVAGFRMFGCNQEFITVDVEKGLIIPVPESINYTEIAVTPFGLSTAHTCLRNANLNHQSKILINGASGGVGLAAVQLAKFLFNAEVTGTCSASKIALVKQAGADHVIDYQTEDLYSAEQKYDCILDTSGKLPFSKAKHLLTPEGQLHLIDFGGKELLQMLWTSIFSKQQVKCHVVEDKIEDLEFAKKLLLEKQFHPMIDQVFPLEQLAEAHRHFESGNKKGNIAVEI